jgi:soluble lytic murein transglycosylase-like protein
MEVGDKDVQRMRQAATMRPKARAIVMVPYVIAAAKKNGVDPEIFVRLVRQESGFNYNATNPKSGARGMTQFMPGTANGLGVDLNDPWDQLDKGALYLKQMLDMFKGDYRLALAAFNAGPGNVRKYKGVPPFKETQDYLRIILGK